MENIYIWKIPVLSQPRHFKSLSLIRMFHYFLAFFYKFSQHFVTTHLTHILGVFVLLNIDSGPYRNQTMYKSGVRQVDEVNIAQ
jgi:hypothetical protein